MFRKRILYLISFLLISSGMPLLRFDFAARSHTAAVSGSGQVYADAQSDTLKSAETVKTAEADLPQGGSEPIPTAAQTGAMLPRSKPQTADTSDAGKSLSTPKPLASQTDRFDQKVNLWISTLASQAEFSAWRNAQWTRYPLGPGNHGWVVILSKNGKDVGYLVVAASQSGEGLALAEYGVGEYPLFSMSTLYTSLQERQLIPASMTLKQFASDNETRKSRIYLNPLHAVWLVSVGNDITNSPETYLDAKTGEIYPLSETEVKASSAEIPALTYSPQQGSIAESMTLPSFDPYTLLNWVKGKPMNLRDWNNLKQKLDQQEKITFAAEIFGKHILIPFAVTGYHQWNEGEPYVQLEQEGARFIPFHSVARWGAFFQRP
ncbi:hypothetical protein [Ferviditalea candida]|uniref:Uncharacterized protein n=1 Tax=Ferviditalea candida TaxID=3108399 RepID=A0ABU5ZCE9_9BACL|nr:hypothetical protein [Paenibacillaceae bacterium T2]